MKRLLSKPKLSLKLQKDKSRKYTKAAYFKLIQHKAMCKLCVERKISFLKQLTTGKVEQEDAY